MVSRSMVSIEAHGLRKQYRTTVALDGIDLRIEEGRIVGLIGPNGAGKTTALNAMLGLTSYNGTLRVLGRDPWKQREDLMRDVCFIADVAVLPRWMRVSQALDYVEGVHPRFDRAKAQSFLAKTTIPPNSKVKELSKGMVTQLHLALIMAIDAKLLVLDEPTLGLDILYRKQFYDSLLNDYFDHTRTIIITTHQVDEIQNILTDVMFIDRGRIVFTSAMDDFESRYAEVSVNPDKLAEARALKPLNERTGFGRSILLFEGIDRDRLATLGEVRTPSIADLFVAIARQQSAGATGGGRMNADTNVQPNAVSDTALRIRSCHGIRHAPHAPPLLVRPPRALGEPRHLHRPARCCRARRPGDGLRRVSRNRQHVVARCPAAANHHHAAVGLHRSADHGRHLRRRYLLLPRRGLWRAPRSQYLLLEITPGLRHRNRALQGEHPSRRSSRCSHLPLPP